MEGVSMKKMRYDVQTSRLQGRSLPTKIARRLFIYSFIQQSLERKKRGEKKKSKNNKTCVLQED